MTENKCFMDILAKQGLALKFKVKVPVLMEPKVKTFQDLFFPAGLDYVFPSDNTHADLKGNNEDVNKNAMNSLHNVLTKIAGNFKKQSSVSVVTNFRNERSADYYYTSKERSADSFYTSKERSADSFYTNKESKSIFRNINTDREKTVAGKMSFLSTSFKQRLEEKLIGEKAVMPMLSYSANASQKNTVTNSGLAPGSLNTITNYFSNTHTASSLSKLTSVKSNTIGGSKDYVLDERLFVSKKTMLSDSSYLSNRKEVSIKNAKSNHYNITQNFGDIVLQPASMDMSIQQVKYKIEDVLKQVRDSLY